MNKLKSLLITVLMGVVRVISPELRELIEKVIKTLYDRALATDNPIDDILVKLIAELLDVDLPE